MAPLDPSKYMVLQEVVRTGAPEGGQHAPEDVLLSIVYKFNNVSATPPLSPDSATFSSDASRPGTAGSHFSSGSTVSFSISHGNVCGVLKGVWSLARTGA